MADDTPPTVDPAASTEDAAGAAEGPKGPAPSASKATWVEWVSTHPDLEQRMSEDEAKGHTRDQLATMYAFAAGNLTPTDPEAEPEVAVPATGGWFLTEGGSVMWMDFPLSEPVAERVVKRAIVQVADEYGTPLAELEPLDVNAVDYVATFAPPPKDASRAVWIGHAVRHGRFTVEKAESMTTQDLIDHFTK